MVTLRSVWLRRCLTQAVLSVAFVLACSSTDTPPASGTAGAGTAGARTGGAALAGASTVAGAGAGPAAAGSSAAGAGAATSGAAGSAGASGGTSGSAGASGASGSGGSAGSAITGKPDIMVLGSSNELITCWRALLWQELQAADIKNFDMVGGVTSGPDCGVAGYDKDLQAQSGQIVTTLPASKFQEWFTAHPPDIILMHFGGADLLNNMAVDGVMKAYALALSEARKVKPTVRLLVAQHTPQDSNGCDACDQKVLELNAAIATWAPTVSQPASPVTAVDLFTGLDSETDFSDGVHLNPAGSKKVADRFFAVLKPLFKP